MLRCPAARRWLIEFLNESISCCVIFLIDCFFFVCLSFGLCVRGFFVHDVEASGNLDFLLVDVVGIFKTG